MDKDEKQKKDGVTVVFEGVSPHAAKLLEIFRIFGPAANQTEGEWISEVIMNDILPKHWDKKHINKTTKDLVKRGILSPEDLML